MRRTNQVTQTSSMEGFEISNYSTNHPVQLFSEWFNECFPEHQIKMAELIGHFCYPKLYTVCKTVGEKIYAFKQYLQASNGHIEEEQEILLFVDEVMEFMGELNEIAYENAFVFKEVADELQNISSLHSQSEDLSERMRTWLITYDKWQQFKKKFPFFSDPLGAYQILDSFKNVN